MPPPPELDFAPLPEFLTGAGDAEGTETRSPLPLSDAGRWSPSPPRPPSRYGPREGLPLSPPLSASVRSSSVRSSSSVQCYSPLPVSPISSSSLVLLLDPSSEFVDSTPSSPSVEVVDPTVNLIPVITSMMRPFPMEPASSLVDRVAATRVATDRRAIAQMVMNAVAAIKALAARLQQSISSSVLHG